MNVDPKELVMVALYSEYQKPIPRLYEVNKDTIGVELPVFNVAVEKLQNEGYISGARFAKGGRHNPPRIVWLDKVTLMPDGIDYAKRILALENEDSTSTLKRIMQKAADWGNERLENIAAKTLAEIIKG